MPMWWESLTFTVIVVAAVSVIVALLQRFAPPTEREHNNAIGATLFELITVLYAVVLAFVLITAWEHRADAERVADNEAAALVETYWSTAALPPQERDEARATLREYTELVIEREWPAMAGHETVGAEGLLLLDRVRAPAADIQESDEALQDRVNDVRDQVRAVTEHRVERLFQAERGLGAMWTVLLPGALLVLAVTFTLGTPTRRYQYVLVGLISGMVALMLFATYQLEYPYSRAGSIGPDAYETALERYDAIDEHYADR